MPRVVSALSFKFKAETSISGSATFVAVTLLKMPTIRWVPRIYTTRYALRSFERFVGMELFDDAAMFMYGQMLCSMDTLDTDEIFMMALTFLAMLSLLDAVSKKKIFTTRARPGSYPASSYHRYWDGHDGEQEFLNRYRFRRADFQRMVTAMGLNGKILRCGRPGREQNYPAEFCLLVLLRRLSYPNALHRLVSEFGLDSNRLCDIYHATLEHIFDRYSALIDIRTWVPFFPEFGRAMQEYGSPYDNEELVGIFDGKFVRCCRPGGLGNKLSKTDQSELYSGEKGYHGIKYMGVLFPNGMVTLSQAFKGRTHDGRALRESGIAQILRQASTYNKHYKVFGDAAFAVDPNIQCMLKDVHSRDGRVFNALMSRIRIHIENVFGNTENQFAYVSYHKGLKLGGRNLEKVYAVATIFMNIQATFYGNQFMHALGYPIRLSVEELLKLAE